MNPLIRIWKADDRRKLAKATPQTTDSEKVGETTLLTEQVVGIFPSFLQ